MAHCLNQHISFLLQKESQKIQLLFFNNHTHILKKNPEEFFLLLLFKRIKTSTSTCGAGYLTILLITEFLRSIWTIVRINLKMSVVGKSNLSLLFEKIAKRVQYQVQNGCVCHSLDTELHWSLCKDRHLLCHPADDSNTHTRSVSAGIH